MNTAQKLDQLAEMKAQKDLLKIKKQELIDKVLTSEMRMEIEAIDLEFGPVFEAVNKKLSEMEKTIKAEIIENGVTVKGSTLQAVYSKGRTRWNDEGLMNYLSVHPEIAYLRTVGKPSVSIRKVGKA